MARNAIMYMETSAVGIKLPAPETEPSQTMSSTQITGSVGDPSWQYSDDEKPHPQRSGRHRQNEILTQGTMCDTRLSLLSC